MANKGKNTNTSQFFILYRPAKHLDRKHTIFGKVVGGLDVLDKMESVPGGEGDRPLEDIVIREVVVFVDPFEEFLRKRREAEMEEIEGKEKRRLGTDEDKVTWTGKRLKGENEKGSSAGKTVVAEVGKYLKAAKDANEEGVEEIIEADYEHREPVKKKIKSTGGFGNFDAW
jgi:peptidyl-prolyl cis-trans isomerase-like protein 2